MTVGKSWLALGLMSILLGWICYPISPSHWSPYQVGAGIGVLSWLTFYCSNTALGASSFYANIAGILGMTIAPKHTKELKYFQDEPPRVNWGFVFMVFAIFGAYLGAVSSGEFSNTWLPELWIARFGEDSLSLRFLVAFAGGAIMAVGARMAGGCTSGHGISGSLQLALGSWLVLISLFVGGTATAMMMYGGLR